MNRQVRKPEHIFDRAREWEGLVRFATADSPGVRLGIVSGRRRRGKTYLLDAAANTFGGFFFTATDSTETESLPSFGRALASYGGGRYAFADWDEALERLFGAVGEGLIIIDEFPYLMKASPSLPSLIQRALGPRGYAQQSSGRLLLSGWRCRSRWSGRISRPSAVTGRCLRELRCSARRRARSRQAWWPIRSAAARSRSTWPSSRRTSQGTRAGCYLSVKPSGTRSMSPGHLERLRRARDLLAVKGCDTTGARLTCYSGAGFDAELADRAAGDPLIQLVGLEELYA